jgi:ubiquinol-cytochrome c reductase cytochrome b subunit
VSDTTVETKRTRRVARGRYGRLGEALNEMDDRLGIARGGRTFMDKIFPDHWSFLLGEIVLYSFIVLLVTGVFLSLYFVPSQGLTIYHGPYKPMDGRSVTQAFASTMDLSFSVRGGLLMRQMHHWACDIFIGAMVLHMARVFFTGAFRKPRELNWAVGLTLLILAISNGFLGYSLPDDLVSGTGIRIMYSIVLSIPLVGSYLAFWLFGGNFPGHIIIARFFVLHVLLIPLIMIGLVTVHMLLLVRQKHTQFKGPGRTEDNVVGAPLFPIFTAKTTGYLFLVSGVIALLGAFAQINPIWQFGPYDPYQISYAVQPDWYMGFLDGILRIFPSWETVVAGHTIPWEVLIPAVIFPGILFTLGFLWPTIERKITKDERMHQLLDRPRDRPIRTACGSAILALLVALFVASATDVIANYLHISLNVVLVAMRIIVVASPFVGFFFAYYICKEMQKVEHGGKRKVPNIVTRTETGEYIATPAPRRDDDVHDELEPVVVPTIVLSEEPVGEDGDRVEAGVRRVER